RGRVEIARGLIGQEQGRTARDRARHRHALLLAPRELHGVVMSALAQAYLVEERPRAFERAGTAAQREGPRHVLEGGERGDEMEGLEDVADGVAPESREVVLVEAGEIHIVDDDAARRRPVEARDETEQGRLAAARGARDGCELARGNLETHVGEDIHRPAAALETHAGEDTRGPAAALEAHAEAADADHHAIHTTRTRRPSPRARLTGDGSCPRMTSLMQPPITWPPGVRSAVCITFDLDAETAWISRDPANIDRISVMSQGAYGPKVGVPLILDFLDENRLTSTFFVPGWTAERWSDVVAEIHRRGHEIGHHGYLHEALEGKSRQEEEAILTGSSKILADITGAPPRGYRAPLYEVTPETAGLLATHGFLYAS